MKKSIKLFAIALIALVSVSTSSYAFGTKEKAITKATEAVESGAPDDWVLLAKQSEYLLNKDAGLSTVKEWLEKSIELKEDTYNLELMGDYYLKCNLNREAIKYYIKTMAVMKVDDANVNTSEIQEKIVGAQN